MKNAVRLLIVENHHLMLEGIAALPEVCVLMLTMHSEPEYVMRVMHLLLHNHDLST